MRKGALGDVLIEIDRRDLARAADEMGHERGVVTGAGTDLEHGMSGFEAELLASSP